MLAKKFRLPVGQWIKEKKGKEVVKKNIFFILKTGVNDLNFSRFGAVVSLKISKSAVRRNYIKRIIFDFIRLEGLHKIAGKDFLIIVLPPAARLKKTELEAELKIIL